MDDADLKKKYKTFLLNSFIDSNKLMKWCPAADCENAVYYELGASRDVYCECGYSFCFTCEREAHAPVDCYYLKMFLTKL